jgi:hypothetical protein
VAHRAQDVVRKWVANKGGASAADVNKHFGIPAELEYLADN